MIEKCLESKFECFNFQMQTEMKSCLQQEKVMIVIVICIVYLYLKKCEVILGCFIIIEYCGLHDPYGFVFYI